MCAPTPSQPPWWVTAIVVPALFTILGFIVGQYKDWQQGRRSKKAFLEAVAVELRAIKSEFEDAKKAADGFLLRLQVSGHAPQLIPNWGTKVFDTQIGKLSNVADDLVGETIEAYSTIGRVERIVAALNENSSDYANARDGNAKAAAQNRVGSALAVLSEEITKALPKLQAIIERLPARKD